MTSKAKMHFAEAVLDWYDRHGRKDLPWQKQMTPYRVWVSEIMLQQTQVTTVIPYYQRFMQRFPSVRSLANANLDTVLEYWAGLGYYARGRNLHKAACQIRDQFGGRFPSNFQTVCELPGIGRSTAGAILALSKGQRLAILDGNVKRVLARYFAVEGWPGQTKISEQLWACAEMLLPEARIGAYTQAMMDLGATVCTRSKPACDRCPVQKTCKAWRENRITELPSPKPRKTLPARKTQMLMLSNKAGEYLLQRRPPVGIWGGLLSFPEIDIKHDPREWAKQTIGEIKLVETWDWFRHTFSHFHLDIKPVRGHLIQLHNEVQEANEWVWYNTHKPKGGLAAPAQKLISRLSEPR